MPPLPIGIGPYADTLCRLDGGIDHKKLVKKISDRSEDSILIL